MLYPFNFPLLKFNFNSSETAVTFYLFLNCISFLMLKYHYFATFQEMDTSLLMYWKKFFKNWILSSQMKTWIISLKKSMKMGLELWTLMNSWKWWLVKIRVYSLTELRNTANVWLSMTNPYFWQYCLTLSWMNPVWNWNSSRNIYVPKTKCELINYGRNCFPFYTPCFLFHVIAMLQ